MNNNDIIITAVHGNGTQFWNCNFGTILIIQYVKS